MRGVVAPGNPRTFLESCSAWIDVVAARRERNAKVLVGLVAEFNGLYARHDSTDTKIRKTDSGY